MFNIYIGEGGRERFGCFRAKGCERVISTRVTMNVYIRDAVGERCSTLPKRQHFRKRPVCFFSTTPVHARIYYILYICTYIYDTHIVWYITSNVYTPTYLYSRMRARFHRGEIGRAYKPLGIASIDLLLHQKTTDFVVHTLYHIYIYS